MTSFPPPPAADLAPSNLAALRAKIDEIDAEVHELLIARSQIIEALIRVKKTGETGAAFRPGREASMMHMLVERHRGGLPLVTIEHVWREIISTFTWLQAHYTVFVSADDAAETRDIARFYFGFTVPFETAETPLGAIASVATSIQDLAVVRLGQAATPWWDALDEVSRPRIIGRLPFLEIEDRPVATPAVVISQALADPVKPEVLCFAVSRDVPNAVLEAVGGEVIASHAGTSCVIAVPEVEGLYAHLSTLLPGAGIRSVGGYAKPISCATAV